MYSFVVSFLFLPCWLALPPRPPAFLARLGADSATAGAAAGSSPPAGEQELPRQGRGCGGAARVLNAGLIPGRYSSIPLVLESALDDLGLGNTSRLSGLLATAT
jgi:hypothetical protein